MSRTPQQKIEILLDRLFEGRLLPFVGAGISMDARNPEHPTFKPTLDYMKGRLDEALTAYLDGAKPADLPRLRWLLRKEVGKDGELIFKNLGFDQLADIVFWLWDGGWLCARLNIHAFCGLQPLPAHRYLAYLAREGLISEIISTNYDCCIEEAYRQSFGPDAVGRTGIDGVKVITDLISYRRDGGLRQKRGGVPTLRLYKINGCANAFTCGHQKPDEILLSERQLQNFGNRRWAHDMLSDRARRHALFFCGFGSEEPQVRHTAMLIMQEFQDFDIGKSMSPDSIADLPNAPFFAAFDPYLKFTQAQIITSFHLAHCSQVEWPNARSVDDHLAASSLTGSDAADLECGSNNTLPADDFFARLYQAAFGRLLMQYAGERSEFYLWLRGVTRIPGAWLSRLRTSLYPAPASAKADKAQQLEVQFGRCRHTLFQVGRATDNTPEEENQKGLLGRGMELWRWIFAAYHPGETLGKKQDWYLPLQQEPQFILGILLVLSCLDLLPSRPEKLLCLDSLPPPEKLNASHEGIKATPGLGLLVKAAGAPSIHLVRDSAPAPDKIDAGSTQCNLLLRVAIPGRQDIGQNGRWQSIENGSIRVGRYYTVTPQELIAAAQTPDRLASSIRKAFAAAPSPKPKAKLTRLTPGSKP